jgi:hypothetical protein
MIFNPLVLILLLLTFVLQEFVPSVTMAYHSKVFLPAAFFFAAAVATSFPMMLVLAFVAGFVWDARFLPAPMMKEVNSPLILESMGNDPLALAGGEISFGVSILLFAVFGVLMQGIRPMFKRGRLELPVVMVGIATFGWLAAQYLIITFVRGNFSFPQEVWAKMITASMLAMLVAPILFLVLHGLARLMSHEIRYEGLTYNFNGR